MLWTRPTAPRPCRIISVRPRSVVELRDLLVDRRGCVLCPRTRASVYQDEEVLLDVRLSEWRLLVWARAHFTVPERRGPMFTCDAADRRAFQFLLSVASNDSGRTRLRFPLRPRVRIRAVRGPSFRGRMLDLSALSARIQLDQRFAPGVPVEVRLDERPLPGFPRRLTGRVIDHRDDGLIVRFTGPDHAAWKELRRTLRRIDESGQVLRGRRMP